MRKENYILDMCCGPRMMWFDRQNPDVVFGDIRNESLEIKDTSHGKAVGRRMVHINPSVIMDFRTLPYSDGAFNLVVFDPPHLVRAGPKSWLATKYGKLGESWRNDLHLGFSEAFRVLKPFGTLIFKWNETQIPVSEILKLTPYPPLFGHISGKRSNTHWVTFSKSNECVKPRLL